MPDCKQAREVFDGESTCFGGEEVRQMLMCAQNHIREALVVCLCLTGCKCRVFVWGVVPCVGCLQRA
jgi:hypothetical protein